MAENLSLPQRELVDRLRSGLVLVVIAGSPWLVSADRSSIHSFPHAGTFRSLRRLRVLVSLGMVPVSLPGIGSTEAERFGFSWEKK